MMRTVLGSVVSVVEPVVTAAVYVGLRAFRRRAPRVAILRYHQIGRPVDGRPMTEDCVSPTRFAEQMRALVAAGYRTISLGEFAQALRERPDALPRRCAVVTFDGGLRGQYTEAFPILQRYGLRATFFVIAAHPAGGASRHLGFENDAPEAWCPFDWRQARTLARNGMEIGSNTITHRALGALEPEEVRIEIIRSKEILQTRIGVPVCVFAYPTGSDGDVAAATRDLLPSAEYSAACTTDVGTNDAGADPFALRRIPVEPRDGAFRIHCKLAGAYDWVGWLEHQRSRPMPRESHVRRAAALAVAAFRGLEWVS
jgi:peptidoglycan/xylan/chitin deacetylase (PgdA/CDA1 family)